MKTLVVIPALIHKYTFSAPLAWMFGNHSEKVDGVYGFALTAGLVRRYKQFIVELNWFIELYEFGLIVRFIRRHNPDARILFGGMHSQLKYHEIFRKHPVDLFIKGDNELPLGMFLDGVDPRTIPNMVGRDFENEHSWWFRQEDFGSLEFNLDWFPEYAQRWGEYPEPDRDVTVKFDKLPLLPRYWEKENSNLPLSYRWRVPSKGGRYHLPMLITGRGACPVVHDGCDYCMASKTSLMKDLFKRSCLVMDNATLIDLLKKIDAKFNKVTLFINSPGPYDLSGYSFDLDATIEFDTFHRADQVKKVLCAFKKTRLHMGLYTEGLVGTKIRDDIASLQELECGNCRVYFFAPVSEAEMRNIPEERRLYAENVFPYWADWNYYNNPKKALRRSRMWYIATGQENLYPPLRKIIARVTRFMYRRILYMAGKSGIINLRRLIT